MARIVFMGTPDFAVPSLEALVETGQVVGVVTQPDRPAGRGNKLRQPPVKVAALAHDLPVFQPKSLRKEAAAAPIREWEPDLIVVTAFGQILRPHLLDLPRLGCVNVHASLLPRWRGAAPIQAAILAGDAETGVTLMQMDVGLDTGDMLAVESFALDAGETASTLHDKLAALGGDMLRRHLDDVLNGRLTPVPQDDDVSTYAPMIQKSDGLLDFTQTAAMLDRRMRAMSPWPGAYAFWDEKSLKILEASPVFDYASQESAGSVIPFGDDGAAVVTSDGVLNLHKVQLAGKKPLPIAEFRRGRPELIGARLEGPPQAPA